MTLQEAKQAVAQKYGLGKTLVTGHLSKYWEEAMQLYAGKYMEEELTEETPVLIGHLTKGWGLNHFKAAEPGHPVYLYKDRYQITLESLDGKTGVTVPFYKKDLEPIIKFLT